MKKNLAKDPEAILDEVFDMLASYVGRAPQRDDLTLVLLKT